MKKAFCLPILLGVLLCLSGCGLNPSPFSSSDESRVLEVADSLRMSWIYGNEKMDQNSSKYGNTTGNITNYGHAAKKDDWIYYSNISDLYKLYKMRTDGTNNSKLHDDKVGCINIVGDWIYYSNNSDDFKLYKIRTDGTNKVKLNDERSFSVNVVDDWIYYINSQDSGGYLYKIRTDGTNKTRLNNDETAFPIVNGDWIYYSNHSDDKKLYKIRTDGTNKTRLNNDVTYDINVVDDWIYYSNHSDDKKLYKIRTDGTERTKLNDDKTYAINVVDEWIYYSNGSDDSKLYKIRTDGTNKVKLNDEPSGNINVVADWIYYETPLASITLEGPHAYRIGIDGRDRQIIDCSVNNRADMERIDKILLTEGKGGRFSVYIKDLNTGADYYTGNPDQPFIAAGSIFPAIWVALSIANGENIISYDDRIRIEGYMLVGGTGSLSTRDIGSIYTVRQLVYLMTYYSDNSAANILIDYMGGIDATNKFIQALQGDHAILNRYLMDTNAINNGIENYISARQLGECMFAFKNDINLADYVFPRADMTAYIPSSVRVYHQVGVLSNVYNEAFFVSGDNSKFVLAVMSQGTNNETAKHVIGKILQSVYYDLES